uniref:Uncharacterized AAA domain-containing protein ycf46 n=1 Tax=Thaumatella adunca TaxID=2006976 RepID=A0A1Z1MMM9_9FLOR|nr:hypothetical protein [Thaumatella adunca]ARW67340.1 hypothetical protein [Thaumatella adunca]
MNFDKEIKAILSSNNFIIYIITEEEERLENIIKNISNQLFKEKIVIWDFIDGYQNNPNYASSSKQNPLEALEIITHYEKTDKKIFFLKDFYNFLNDFSINRKLKNLSKWLKQNNKYIIFNGTEQSIPITLREYITSIKLPLPNRKEIKTELNKFFNQISINPNSSILIDSLSNAYTGFSINKIRQSISKLIIDKTLEKQAIKKILNEKEKIIQQTGSLKFYSQKEKISDIGGLNNLKIWLDIRYLTFTKKAHNYGIKQPKGILLVGIQGTGKSLSAKTISTRWNLPLLRLDISNIFTGILGESENKIQHMIKVCEQIAPCILWIDEIDKIFIEYTNNNDSGTTQRITNIFLTWLSEEQKNVFIVATANTIKYLPIEILRKGRFDEIFFIDLPNFIERIKIFQIHIKKIRPLSWKKYNIYYLSKISKKFSGAEIEQSIIEAMYIAFYENREFTTKDIKLSIENIIPLAHIEKEKILKLRQWGHSGKIKIA